MPESAVSVFSKTWSKPRQRRPIPWSMSRHRNPSNNLPAELLLIIFKLVHDSEKTLGRVPVWWPNRTKMQHGQEVDVRSPSLWPYAIAAVCSLWRDVALLVPEFWTRLVIFLDQPPNPLITVVSLLSWSRDLPLDVTLTRQAFDDAVDGPHERSQLISVMKDLQPHIHRIKELEIHVMFSSSLPSFPDDFHGHANILTALELRCNEDDGGPIYPLDDGESPNSLEDERFQCRELVNLTIDGRNCYNAYMNGTPWTDMAPELMNLAISHYTPQPGESFPAYDLLHPLRAIGTLEMLSIANFTFDPDDRYEGWGGRAGLIYLGIEGCHNSEDIAEIFRILGGVDIVAFTRCDVEPSFGAPWNFDIDFDMDSILTLREISDQDLVPLLGLWDGDDLWVEDCPSFDDSILAAMRTRKNGRFPCAPRLKFLGIEISATSNATFSVAALKRFVATRLEADDEYSASGSPRFNSLSVRGNVPYLSPEDRTWFMEKTEKFEFEYDRETI